MAQVGALRDVPPDEAVLVLVAASFAWRVRVAVVDLGALAFAAAFLFHAGRVGELAAIVDRDAGEDLREQGADFALDAVQGPDDAGARLIPQRDDDLLPGLALSQHEEGVADALAAFDAVHLPVAEGLTGVDFFRPLLDALACRGPGDGALWCLSGRLALAALRQHFGRELVAEHFAADVIVDGARADLRLEAPAVDLGLADGSLGAVLLVADLLDEVVGQLVVVAELQIRALRLQVLPVEPVGFVRVVADLGGQVAVEVLIGGPLHFPVDGGIMDADLLGDLGRLHAGTQKSVDLDPLGHC